MTATSTVLPAVDPLPTVKKSRDIHVVFRRPPRWKRTIDIVGSLALILALLPLLASIALYVKLVSRGPAIFRQKRIGAGATTFVINKFRTLHVTDDDDEHRRYVAKLADSDVPAQKPNHQRRMIPGGYVLRSLSLDELPQLFNVLIGEMSLIGPRPEVLELEDYEPWQLRRFEVLPGISGLWQVSGKNRLTFKQMVDLDIRYVDNLSMKLDLIIMLKTIRVIFTRDNH